jgi:hypothetical protein
MRVFRPFLSALLVLGGTAAAAAVSAAIGAPEQSTTPELMNDFVRDLQSDDRLYDIGIPVVGYQGLQLNMDYIVRDQITADAVKVTLYRDEACTRAITAEENDYLSVDIIPDLTTLGDGSGTRTVSIVYIRLWCVILDDTVVFFSTNLLTLFVSF